jgi:hypothetical protein
MPTEEEVLSFSQKIEAFAKTSNLGVLESIIAYCEKHEIEVETISSLISQNLKQKIREEAEELNLLPKANTLPL